MGVYTKSYMAKHGLEGKIAKNVSWKDSKAKIARDFVRGRLYLLTQLLDFFLSVPLAKKPNPTRRKNIFYFSCCCLERKK